MAPQLSLFRAAIIAMTVLFLSISSSAWAGTRQDMDKIRETVTAFVRDQMGKQPGEMTITVGTIDPRLSLPTCSSLQAFVPSGTRLWAKTRVGVRCDQKTWTIYVPVTIQIMGDVVISHRTLTQGQIIKQEDLSLQKRDLSPLSPRVLTSFSQAVGKVISNNLIAGHILHSDMLRKPTLIQNGEAVTLIINGRGFKVSSEAKAIGQAAEGQVIQARTASGQVVSGIARQNATVEIRH